VRCLTKTSVLPQEAWAKAQLGDEFDCVLRAQRKGLMLGIVTIVLALVLIALVILLFWRERRVASLVTTAFELDQILRTGSFAARIPSEGTSAPLAATANRLLEHIAVRDLQLKERERTFTGLLGSVHEAVAIQRDTLLFANARFASLLGVRTPQELVGRQFSELVSPDYADLLHEHLRRLSANDPAPERLEIELQPAAGQTARVELSVARIDYQGRPALLLTLVEMSPRAVLSSVAQRSRSSAWEAMDSMGDAIITADASERIDYLNHAAEQLLNIKAGEAMGRKMADLVSLVDESDRHALSDPVHQCLTTRARVSVGRRGLMIVGGSTDERSVEITASPLKNNRGELAGAVIVIRDVSEARGLSRQMSYQATHDALTGLINRLEFERRTQEVLEHAQTNPSHHVLCYLDLDRFKAVNDTSGHLAGDNMLREVAALVKETVRDSDTAARLGGDEFGLLLLGCPLEKARQIADDVVRSISEYRFVWKDKIFSIGVSVGLVEISRESGSLEELLSAADSACYVAKKQGNHVQVYSARDEAVARHRGEIHWLQRLQTAIKENRFELLAQPIFSATKVTNEGPALEVLLRLQDESVPGGIAPAEFLRAAERYRLMVEVDRWVVQTALTALGRGGIRLPEGRSLAINLSGQTLGDPNFLEFVVDCLDHTGVTPQQLCFEVTESSVITNMEHAQRFIGVLHGMGCRFALDDFGRGLSSFANLKNLSIDYLKIDGSFIRNLASDNVNQAMVAAMVKLARTLNFKVIAEQVEDSSALEAARKMGVDFLQGFQLGRPQPLARVVAARAS
jgi:diguanylate cyclase (GGDEF)-like protein/PAS domain S-box-containing protein